MGVAVVVAIAPAAWRSASGSRPDTATRLLRRSPTPRGPALAPTAVKWRRAPEPRKMRATTTRRPAAASVATMWIRWGVERTRPRESPAHGCVTATATRSTSAVVAMVAAMPSVPQGSPR